MAHARSHTGTTVATGSKTTMWDKEDSTNNNSTGPMEWRIDTDEDIDVYVSGTYPEAANAVRVKSGETYYFGNPGRSITLIEMQAVSSAATVSLRPSIV